MKKTTKKKFIVKPGLYAACVELAADPAAGGLLCQIVLMSEGNTLKDQKGETGWLSLSRTQWMVLTSFTRHQHDRAVKCLKDRGLIESFRRKLKYNDPAALAWIRLAEKTKSGIAEIKEREGISAFAEHMSALASVLTEKDGELTSAITDSLKEMNKTKNEKEVENVIVEKTITEESTVHYKEVKQKESKGSSADEKWFTKTMDEIYGDSPFTAEPYNHSACAALRNIMEWLAKNPGMFHSACKGYPDPVKAGLKAIIHNWVYFCQFSHGWYNTYNHPSVPQVWSLKHQSKVIPDYIKFLAYFKEVQNLAEAGGKVVPKDSDQISFSTGYFDWLSAADEDKSKRMASVVNKLSLPKEYKLWKSKA